MKEIYVVIGFFLAVGTNGYECNRCRYLPPKGTAGFARSRVRRVPLPPASTMPNTRVRTVPSDADADARSGVMFSATRPSQDSSAARCYQRSRRGS